MTPRVLEPVARSTDPLTSYLAGDDFHAREASEKAVRLALRLADGPLSDWQIECVVRGGGGLMEFAGVWSGSRLRTARKQLEKKGVVVLAGIKDRVSESGRKAQVWRLA